MENVGSTYCFMPFPLATTHLACKYIHKWSPARGSCRCFDTGCSRTDGSWFPPHSGHLRAEIVRAASINTKITDEKLVMPLCLINHISWSHMAQCRHRSTHYYVKIGSFMPWQFYSWCPLDRDARTSLDVANNRQIYFRSLWPCIVSKIWREKTNKMQQFFFDGATAWGGPWPPLQYASKPLDPLLCLSIRLFPSFSGPWTRHPSISFLVFLFVLLHTAFRTSFSELRYLAFFLYDQAIVFFKRIIFPLEIRF